MKQGIFSKIISKTGVIKKISDYLVHYQNQRSRLEKQAKNAENAMIGSGCTIDEMTTIRNEQSDKKKILIGANTVINNADLLIYRHGGEISIGDHCFVGPGTRIWSAKKIKIGNRVLISHNVNIHDNNSHPLDSLERHKDFTHIATKGLPLVANYNEQDIVISDDAWIGFNATILKGVTIGRGAIIGASSVITSNVPDFAVVAGNPQQIIKYTT